MKQFLVIFLLIFGAVEITANPSFLETEIPAFVSDSYEIIDLLGKGSQGRVYRARDRFSGLEVAIKFFLTDNSLFADYTEAKNEEQVSYPLDDVPLLRGFVEKLSDSIIVLEYIPGKTLEQNLETRTFTLEETEFFIGQLLDGIEEILNRNVIPIDIALDNLMIDESRNHLRMVDAACFIDLNLFSKKEKCQVFREGMTKTIEGKEYPITPALCVYLTASDVFDIINTLRENISLPTLPKKLKLSYLNEGDLPGNLYEELELLRDLFKEWIANIKTSL